MLHVVGRAIYVAIRETLYVVKANVLHVFEDWLERFWNLIVRFEYSKVRAMLSWMIMYREEVVNKLPLLLTAMVYFKFWKYCMK